eukprot:1038446_1
MDELLVNGYLRNAHAVLVHMIIPSCIYMMVLEFYGSHFTYDSVEEWKLRAVMKQLSSIYKGNRQNRISFMIPPNANICHLQELMSQEYICVRGIKSRRLRLSAQRTIISVINILQSYTKIPPHGLIIYDTKTTHTEKEIIQTPFSYELSIHFEPSKPITTLSYTMDYKFNMEPLTQLMHSSVTIGFIVIDRKKCLFATLTGLDTTILHTFSVDLPLKHFPMSKRVSNYKALRDEAICKCAELATHYFIQLNKPTIGGLVLAGSFKHELYKSHAFDEQLRSIVVKTVDTSYGGKCGFHEAIASCCYGLGNVALIREKELLTKFMLRVKYDDKCCFGVENTMRALEIGAIKTLIVWEELSLVRAVFQKETNDQHKILFVSPEIWKQREQRMGAHAWQTRSIVDKADLLKWLVDHYMDYHVQLELVTDKSKEGKLFAKGLGGIGALLQSSKMIVKIKNQKNESQQS